MITRTPKPLLFRCVASAVSAATREAQAANADPVGLPQLAQVIGALLLVVIAIFALAALAQRVKRLQQGRGRILHVVDGIALGTRDRLVLVEVGGERLLLGITPGRIERLHVLPAGAATGGRAPFASALAEVCSPNESAP